MKVSEIEKIIKYYYEVGSRQSEVIHPTRGLTRLKSRSVAFLLLSIAEVSDVRRLIGKVPIFLSIQARRQSLQKQDDLVMNQKTENRKQGADKTT
ncbi:hypothetical protein C7B80_23785 [Cyanosarcina cf. burmensis CCALA 770]|nr:hypothetical protein C7B80_23785 [Cyanosarcina cf. burmensis CCALA 770]